MNDPVEMMPCPFCGGPPCVDAFAINRRRRFHGQKRYSSNGKFIRARAWCHECGATGGSVDDIVFSNDDVIKLKRKAAELWNIRDSHNQGMFVSSAAEKLNFYPRPDGFGDPL